MDLIYGKQPLHRQTLAEDPLVILNSCADSLWRAGQPLENGTNLARFMIRGDFSATIRARPEAQMSVASGEVSAPGASHTDISARVRGVVDRAAALIDRES